LAINPNKYTSSIGPELTLTAERFSV